MSFSKHKYQDLTDEELLRQYRETRDQRWLGFLLDRYTLLLFGVSLKYLKNQSAAEDAVQQVFLKVLSYQSLMEIRNFKSWLYILARNHCLQVLRDRDFHVSLEDMYVTAVDEEEVILRRNHERTLSLMEESLGELSEKQQLALKLFYLEKKSYQEISETTGYSFKEVKSFIQNGKRNLKSLLIKKLESHDYE